MRRILAVCALAFATATPALAQYYPYPPQRYYEPRPRYVEPGWGGGWRGGGYYQQPVIYGNICITSRGNCRTQPLPNGAPCRCFIPGFGPKRGNIQAGGW